MNNHINQIWITKGLFEQIKMNNSASKLLVYQLKFGAEFTFKQLAFDAPYHDIIKFRTCMRDSLKHNGYQNNICHAKIIKHAVGHDQRLHVIFDVKYNDGNREIYDSNLDGALYDFDRNNYYIIHNDQRIYVGDYVLMLHPNYNRPFIKLFDYTGVSSPYYKDCLVGKLDVNKHQVKNFNKILKSKNYNLFYKLIKEFI